jgi:hypothetical protein
MAAIDADTLEIQVGSSVWVPLALVVAAVLMALFSAQVLVFSCTRSTDTCSYTSLGLGISQGELRLSDIAEIDDQGREEVGAQVNTRYWRVQHHAVLRNGSAVPLEVGSRLTMIGEESLVRRFRAFRQGREEHLYFPELTFGFGGVGVLTLLVLGLVMLVFATRVRVRVSGAHLCFQRRGVIGGFRTWEGLLTDLTAVECNKTGSYPGTYLRVPDGLLKLGYGLLVDGDSAGRELAAFAGVPLVEIDDRQVREGATGLNPLPALGCMGMALSPVAIPCVWGVVSSLMS